MTFPSRFMITILLGTLLTVAGNAYSCTDFRLIAKDGAVIVTRSMEFGVDMKSNLRTSTKDRSFTTTAPDGKPGLSWKANYGYVYLDAFNQDFTVDGMNEAGLSFEYLYLPGETQYQTVPAGQDSQALPYLNLGDWALSNFSTVAEVRQALSNIHVFEQKLPSLNNMVFPLHAAITDASGNSIIIEFVGGKMNIYDNKVGILTNSPQYPWHLANIRNYINLSPYVPEPITANGLTFAATGQGTGMVGVPGDFSPPSRFIKIATLIKTAYQANDAISALILAQHIINNVDIPLGTVRSREANGKDMADSTEWVVFKDLKNKVFYYKTYDNSTIGYVEFAKLNFAPNAKRLKMPIASKPVAVDQTSKFLSAIAN